jgi:hypothetical protein
MYIILIILVLLIPIPLYVVFKSFYSKEKNRHGHAAVQRSFKEVIRRHRLTISEVNKFVNRLIAIDRNTGRLVIVVHRDGVTCQKCIGFEEITGCEITSATDPVSGYIQSVTMELSLHHHQKNVHFAFFDDKVEDVRDLGRRTKQAGYWQKKIQYYLYTSAASHKKLNASV